MPEGDTIATSAQTLAGAGRADGHRPAVGGAPASRRGRARLGVAGSTVAAVESRGKHLLIRFSMGAVLRTHMRMTGPWHLYRVGSRWQKPARLARVVLGGRRRGRRLLQRAGGGAPFGRGGNPGRWARTTRSGPARRGVRRGRGAGAPACCRSTARSPMPCLTSRLLPVSATSTRARCSSWSGSARSTPLPTWTMTRCDGCC